jgi:acetolactate synthase-1/2/3 large subunit
MRAARLLWPMRSERTRFTKGIVKTNLGRFTLGNQARFVGRALLRKVTG